MVLLSEILHELCIRSNPVSFSEVSGRTMLAYSIWLKKPERIISPNEKFPEK